MASVEEVQQALEEAREHIEELNKEIVEKDLQIAEIENSAAQSESAIEAQWRSKLDAMNEDWEKRAAQVAEQRDTLMAAVQGDTGGWVEKANEDGTPYYENANTGDVVWEKPMIYEVATMVQASQAASNDKAVLMKANRKAKDAENKFRKVDLMYTECKTENNNLKAVLDRWNEASGLIHENMNTFDSLMNEQMDRVMDRINKHRAQGISLEKSKTVADRTTEKIKELQAKIQDWEQRYDALAKKHSKLSGEYQEASNRIKELEATMEDEIERRVAPIQEELSQAYAELMKAKAKHEQDLVDVVVLWPQGFLLPSLLQRYQDLSPMERQQKRSLAEQRDAQLAITNEIQDKAAIANQWQELADQYGQRYFLNNVTQETVWEIPEEMMYQPPEGYELDGHRTRQQMSEQTKKKKEKKKKQESPWTKEVDQYGQEYYVHKDTGDVSWEPPPDFVDEGASVGGATMDTSAADTGMGLNLDKLTGPQMVLIARKVITHLREEQKLALQAGEEFIVDWQAVEELAAGQEGWEYNMDQDDAEDEDELEVVDPTEHELRKKIYEASIIEQKCELKLARLRKKIVEWSHEMVRLRRDELDRLLGIQKDEDDDAIAEARRKAAEAMKDTEDMIAKAMEAFQKGEDISVAEEEEEESLRSRHTEASSVTNMTQKQQDTISEMARREAFPRSRGIEDSSYSLSALAIWAGYLGKKLEPLHIPKEEMGWKAAAFMGELVSELGSDLTLHEKKLRALRIDDLLRKTKELPLLQSSLNYAMDRLHRDQDQENDDEFLRKAFQMAEKEALMEEEEEAKKVELMGTLFEDTSHIEADNPPAPATPIAEGKGGEVSFTLDSFHKGGSLEGTKSLQSLTLSKGGEMESIAEEVGDSHSSASQSAKKEPSDDKDTAGSKDDDELPSADKVAEPKEEEEEGIEEITLFDGTGQKVEPSFPLIKPRPKKEVILYQEAIEIQKEEPGSWRTLGEREIKRRQYMRMLLLEAAGKSEEEAEEFFTAQEEDSVAGEDDGSFTTEQLRKRQELRNRAMWDMSIELLQKEAMNHALEMRMVTEEIKAVSEVNWKRHDAADFDLQKKGDTLKKMFEETNKKYEDTQKEIERLFNICEELRKPLPEPVEPEKPSLPEYVPMKLPEAIRVKRGSESQIQMILDRINDGTYDTVGNIPVPDDLSLDDKQRESIEAVVTERNQRRQSEKQRVEAKYEREMQTYRVEMDNWRAETRRRKDELFEKEKQLSIIKEKGDLFEKGKEMAKLLTEWIDQEIEAEHERAKQMWEAANRAEVASCKQVMEFDNHKQAIERLQLKLEIAVDERDRALRMARGAINEQERVELQKLRTTLLQRCRENCAEIRQALTDEGRRRKWLYSEEFSVVKQELRRVRQEESQFNEREDLITLVDSLIKGEEDARKEYISFRENEINTMVDVVHGGRGLAPSQESSTLLQKWKEEGTKLEAAITARMSACVRQGDLYQILYANLDLLTVPAEYFWVPQAVHQRYEEQIQEMEELQRDQLMRARTFVEEADHRVRVYQLVHERMKQQMHDRDDAHRREVESLKVSFIEGVRVLKPLIEKTRQQLQKQIDQLEKALTDLSKEFNDYTAKSVTIIDELQANKQLQDAWVATLRHEMRREVVRRSVLQDDYNRLMDRYKNETVALKEELRMERAHSNRVRLWIAGMHSDVRHYLYEIRKREEQQRQIAEADEIEKRRLRFTNWQNQAALYILFTDVDNLFLFFAQRLANLAGARKMYNERLRINGAIEVLLALSKCPRQDLRTLASRALAGFGWDGFVEHRIVGWNCKRHWQNWVAEVIPAREQQIRALRISFEEEKKKQKGKKITPLADLLAKAGGTQGTLLPEESLAPSLDASTHTEFHEEDEEFVPSSDMNLRDIIRARRQWALRRARRKESPNPENQVILGISENSVNQLVKLMQNEDWEIVRNAVLSLSIASYDDANSETLGSMQGCVKQVVLLLRSEDLETRAHAAAAIANMGYGNRQNQEIIGDEGGVEALVELAASPDLDAIEASVAALANVLCYNDANAVRLADAGGIEVLASLITTSRIANLLDADQLTEIHANCAEALANATRAYTTETSLRIHHLGIAPLVLLCGSSNLQVVRHSALILGNVAQNEEHRLVVGARGGVEALVLLANHTDRLTQANALWALANLIWCPENQERIGRYMGDIFALCSHAWLPVRTNAVIVLANAVYFHEDNRLVLEELDIGLQSVMAWCAQTEPEAVQESALRAMISLTYNDRVALPLPERGEIIPLLLSKIAQPASVDIQRFSLMTLINIAVHDVNKRRILEAGGVEILVDCQGSEHEKIRDLSRQILDALADITDMDELAEKRKQFGVRGLFQLLQNDNVTIQKLAAEGIAEEVWLDKKKQKEVLECGGIEILLTLTKNVSSYEDKVLLPVLWSLRNSIHNNLVNRERASGADGVANLLSLCKFYYVSKNPKLLEASLTTFINLIIDNERNCRKVIKTGLDILIDIAESYEASLSTPAAHSTFTERQADRDLAKSNAALAASILQIVGPYNYIFCTNCKAKQSGGTTCSQCGHALSLDEQTLAAQF